MVKNIARCKQDSMQRVNLPNKLEYDSKWNDLCKTFQYIPCIQKLWFKCFQFMT